MVSEIDLLNRDALDQAQFCGWHARETLKPNLSGCPLNKRDSSVLLPTPDGPEITRGRKKSGRGDMSIRFQCGV